MKAAKRCSYESLTRRENAESKARIAKEDRELDIREKAHMERDRRENRRSLAAFIREVVVLSMLIAVAITGLLTQTPYLAFGGLGGTMLGGVGFAIARSAKE